jgi:hypothetical protein
VKLLRAGPLSRPRFPKSPLKIISLLPRLLQSQKLQMRRQPPGMHLRMWPLLQRGLSTSRNVLPLLRSPKLGRPQVFDQQSLLVRSFETSFVDSKGGHSSLGTKSPETLPLASGVEATQASPAGADFQVAVTTPSVSVIAADAMITTVSQGSVAPLSPIDSIREGLIRSTADQFFTTLEQCVQLVMFNGQPFSLLQPLLDHIIDSIRRLGGDARAEPFAARVTALDQWAARLRVAENMVTPELLHVTLASFRLGHTKKLEELKARKEKAATEYDQLNLEYEESSNDYLAHESTVRLAKQNILDSEEMIRKAEAAIAENRQIIASEEEKMAPLSVHNHEMYDEIQSRYKVIESLVAEHNEELQVTDEDLQQKASRTVENLRLSSLELAREELLKLSCRF